MAEAPTPQGLLNSQSFGTIAPYEPNMVERAQGLLAQGLMKFGYDPRDAYVQANKIINTQGDVGAADFTPIAGDLIGAQDAYDMGVDAKRAFNRDEYLKALGYGAGSAATGILSGLGVLGTVVPPVDKAIDAARVGVNKVTGLLDDVDDLGFYSPTERLADNLQPKGTGDQYLGILSKGDGQGSRIQEEMADMGLDTWLQGKGKVSRDEVLDYIGKNRLRYNKEVLGGNSELLDNSNMREIDEHLARGGEIYGIDAGGDVVSLTNDVGEVFPYVRGDPAQYYIYKGSFDDAVNRNAEPKYDMYAQEGGTNYQEGLLTVPNSAEKFKAEHKIKDGLWDFGGGVRIKKTKNGSYALQHPDPHPDRRGQWVNGSSYGSLDQALKENNKFVPELGYKSPHYDQANIGLTTRTQSFNTPEGNSVHLMDELQSDWHQEGKKKGYKTPRDKKTFDALTQEKADRIVVKPTSDGQFQGFWTRPEDDWLTTGIRGSTEEEALLNTLGDTHDIRYKNATGVPNAPAKQSWMNQGIKKEINQTIADGKDYFAWTGGDIQADRYSLRKQVETIDYDMSDNTLSAYAPDGSVSIMETVQPDKLDDFIGKEAADKVRERMDSVVDDDVVRLQGEELEVGGEGMKSFYDKDVKKRTEKIIKRLDPKAKVEVIELDNGNKVWGVKITDQMRDKVKGEGMPLYSIAPIAGAGLLGAGMMRQEDQQPQQGILN